MSFILTSACRNFRGYVEDGKSMLIHVSKFQDVQQIVYRQVSDYMDVLRSRMQAVIIFMMKLFQNLRKFGKKLLFHKDKTEEKMPTWQDLLDHKYSLKFIIMKYAET